MSARAQVSNREAIARQREEAANSGRRGASVKRASPIDVTNSVRGVLLVSALALTACTQQPAQQPANVATAETPAPTPSAPTPAPAPTAEVPAAPVTPTAATPLTGEGWGPLRIGMTRAEITAALGPDANPQAVGGPDPESCDQYRPARAPEGMLVMVEAGRLTRIDLIRNAPVRTARGLGLGATAAQVRTAHGQSVSASPHKYVDKPAEYLTVWSRGGGSETTPPPALSRGIRYEVDGSGRVARIHAGGPSILYVEGCA